MPGAMRAASTRWQPLRLNALDRSHVAMQSINAKAVFQAKFGDQAASHATGSQPLRGSLRLG